jgi:RES domain-containing protein
VTLPPLTRLHQDDTHRLIPSQYGDSVLTRIAQDAAHLETLFEIDNLTNDRLYAEQNLLPGITSLELVSGFPHYRVVNAAFCYAHPEGSRFNGPDRGAWYAAFERESALAEVVFHKTLALAEIDTFDDDVTYEDYLSDFRGEFHHIRDQDAFAECLDPDSYVVSQALAARLLRSDSAGIVYPSVRYPQGTNLVCFRPALVSHVRQGNTCRLVWQGTPAPEVIWL